MFFINVNQNKFFVEKFMKRSGAAQNSEKLKARSSKLKVQRKKRALRIGKGEVVRRSGMDLHAIRRLGQTHNKLLLPYTFYNWLYSQSALDDLKVR